MSAIDLWLAINDAQEFEAVVRRSQDPNIYKEALAVLQETDPAGKIHTKSIANFIMSNYDISQMLNFLSHVLPLNTLYYLHNLKIDSSQELKPLLNKILIKAASRGKLEIIKYLNSANLADVSANDNTAIQEASANGHFEVVKFLLRFIKDIDVFTVRKVFIKATKYGHLKIVKLLMRNKLLSVDIESIVIASRYGRSEIVNYLLSYKSVDIDRLDRALEEASQGGHRDVVDLLLEAGVKPEYTRSLALASESGHEEIVRLLLNLGVDPSDFDNEAIQNASKYGHHDVVRLLLADDRVDPNVDNYAIIEAIKGRHFEVIKLLLNDRRFNFVPKGDEWMSFFNLDVSVLYSDPAATREFSSNEHNDTNENYIIWSENNYSDLVNAWLV